MAAFKVLYVCLLGMILLALFHVSDLSWQSYLRLAGISVGLSYLYFRGGNAKALFGRDSQGQHDDSMSQNVYASILIAIAFMLIGTQFDTSLTFTSTYPLESHTGWAFLGYFVLSIVAYGAYWVGYDHTAKGEQLTLLHKLDRYVIVIGVGIIIFTVCSKVFFLQTPIAFGAFIGSFKTLEYMLLWFCITRVYGSFIGHGLESSEPQTLESNLVRQRWVLFTSILGLFIVTSFVGAFQVGKALYLGRQAELYYASGDYQEALLSYKKWMQLNQHLGFYQDEHLENVAFLYALQGEDENFEKTVGILVDQLHGEAEIFEKKGQVYYRAKRWDKAIVEYESLVSKGFATNEDILEKLGTSYFKAGYIHPLLAFTKKYEYMPSVVLKSFDEYMTMGTVYLHQEQDNLAIAHFEQAVAIDSEAFYAHYQLGKTLLLQSQVKRATQHFLRVVALDSTFSDGHYQLGLCYEKQGLIESASLAFEKAYHFLPEHLDALTALKRLKRLGSSTRREAFDRLTPDIVVNERLSDDIVLVGYDLPAKIIKLKQPIDLTLYWRLARDTVATPQRVHILMAHNQDYEQIDARVLAEGPYFSIPPSQWKFGEIVKTEHDYVVTGQNALPLDCGYGLMINVMYYAQNQPTTLFFIWSGESWTYSTSHFISDICLER